MRHCGLGQEVTCWYHCWKNSTGFVWPVNNFVAIVVKMNGFRFQLTSKLDWGSYITSVAKTVSKKIGALIRSMKFLSPEVALYLYTSTIRPCMDYCCHVWSGDPRCYLELLDKLRKRIWGRLVLHLLPLLNLSHRWNVASLSLFYRY